jgi:hypothetical protein
MDENQQKGQKANNIKFRPITVYAIVRAGASRLRGESIRGNSVQDSDTSLIYTMKSARRRALEARRALAFNRRRNALRLPV